MKRLFYFSLGICITFGGMCFFPPTAFAQTQPFTITTTPQFFDITANPGDTVSKIIRVRNNAESPITLSVSTQKLIPDTQGQIILRNFSAVDVYKDWLHVQSSSVSALPKEWTDIPFTITIPKTAAFGYYWALLLSSNPSGNQTGTTTHVSGAVAIPVLLTVQNSNAVTGAKLIHFQTNHFFFEWLPVDFLTTIKNTGNVHIRPSGTIFITDMFGNQVAKVSLNTAAGAVLPSATRVFDTSWNDSFITQDAKMEDGQVVVDSKGKPEMHLTIHFDKLLSLRMGKYSATEVAVVSGASKDITFQASTTFFVFPWKILLGAVLVILLAGVGLWSTLKNIWHHGKRLIK